MLQQIFSRQLRFTQNNGQPYPNWEQKRLEDVVLKKSSTIAANAIKSKVGKYAIYGASGLLKHIDFFQEEQAYIGIVKDGAGVGRAFLCEAKSSVLGTLDIIKAKTAVNILFLYYVLGQIHFKKYIVGSTIPHIYFKSYKTQKLFLPSLPEQQKIGNFLSRIDQHINNLRQQLHVWQQYKKGLLQQIFSQQLRFKSANGVNYPKWEVKQLGKLCQIQRGSSPRPISSPQWFNPNSSVGWVRISDVTKSHRTLLKTQQYLSDKGIEKSRFVRKGNLIMSICATIGKPIFVGFDVCIHDGFVVFNNLTINKTFMYYLLEKIEKRWYKYGQHGIQVNLNTTIVSTEKVEIPLLAEQQQISTFLSSIDTKITHITKRLATSQAFKKGLLQQLFV